MKLDPEALAAAREASQGTVGKSEPTSDNLRCRWPDCSCYSPQGPQKCGAAVVNQWLWLRSRPSPSTSGGRDD